MSQFPSTLATSELYNPLFLIITDSTNDVSYFKVPAIAGEVLSVWNSWHNIYFASGNLIQYDWVDDTDTVVATASRVYEVGDNGMPFLRLDYEVPTTGDYYLKVTATGTINRDFNVSVLKDVTFRLAFEEQVVVLLFTHYVPPPINAIANGKYAWLDFIILDAKRRTHLGLPSQEYYQGTGVIRGYLTVDGSYSKRRIRLYAKGEGILLAETWSDPASGYYEFKNYATPEEIVGAKYYTTGHDYLALDNAAIADFLVAEVV